jgi:hypothetical protein
MSCTHLEDRGFTLMSFRQSTAPYYTVQGSCALLLSYPHEFYHVKRTEAVKVICNHESGFGGLLRSVSGFGVARVGKQIEKVKFDPFFTISICDLYHHHLSK